MQTWSWKKTPKNLTKICLGIVLGSILEGFGTVLSLFWAFLAGSWPFLGRSKSSFFSALALDGLQNTFWSDFKSILGVIQEDLGGFRKKILMICGRFWKFLS